MRHDLPIRGNNTNNYCEAAMRVLKDKVLSRTKAFNVPQLADFVSNHLEGYYERRVIDVANGRYDNLLTSKHMLNAGDIQKDHITQVSANQFTDNCDQDGKLDFHITQNHMLIRFADGCELTN